MSSTVAQIVGVAGAHSSGPVPWSSQIPPVGPGIYVVAATSSPTECSSPWSGCPISLEAVGQLLSVRPELRVDGERPSPDELAARIASFWLPDEVILYVGLAGKSVSLRVGDYYRTPIGAQRPHAGGWFIKTLGVLDDLWVHFASCDDPDVAEYAVLERFVGNVSSVSRSNVHDPDRPFPFANLEWPRGTRRRHGITGARGDIRPMVKRDSDKSRNVDPDMPRAEPYGKTMVDRESSPTHLTQPVTGPDLRAGRIRIPRGGTKRLFPGERCDIELVLRGHHLLVRWDPRYGPDRERSGVLGIGNALLGEVVKEGEKLNVVTGSSGTIALD